MNSVKNYVVLFVVLTLINSHLCGRSSGGRRGGGYGSSSRSRPHTTARSHTTPRPRTSTYRTSTSPGSYYQQTTPRSHRSSTLSTARPAYNVGSGNNNNNNVGWNIPPKPQAPPAGGYQGPQNVKIVNKYNYHYPGYYSVPSPNYAHPGYYNTPSSYHYSSFDTGSTALGLFLGYGLAKLTTPTYSHHSFYDGYRPQYDHYEVHHYYHNKESVPQNQEIQSNTIVGCVGDSGTVCPANTTSLCTSNGALMCVVSATSTVPCTDNRQINCVKSTISCVNNTAAECKNQNSTTISIPCVSNAKVHGDLKFENNTIIVANSTNTTTNGNSTTPAPQQFSTKYPITTTPTSVAETTTPTSGQVTSDGTRVKRDAQQNFCVTVIALPAKRKETEGEVFLNDAKSIFDNFIESSWNL